MRVEDEVLAAVRRRADALAAGDRSGLEAVLHPRFRWTSHRGEVFEREAYLRSNIGGRLRWRAQVLEQVDVVVVGDTGLVTCLVIDQVELAGEPRTFRMPVTQTWVRTTDGWLCLAGHAGPSG